MTSITEYDNQEQENNFKINNIASYLYSIGYINSMKYHSFIKKKKSKEEGLIFETNYNITYTDASVKYGELLSKINKLFNINTNFEELFLQYYFCIKKMNFTEYLNYLILLSYIVDNFSDIINIYELVNLTKSKIIIIDLDDINNYKENSLKSQLKKVYETMKNKKEYKDKEINYNLVLLIFFLSLNNTNEMMENSKDINDLINKFSFFNKVYLSNIELSILLYIELTIFIDIFSKKAFKNREKDIDINNIEKPNSNRIFNKKIEPKKSLKKINEMFEKLARPFTSRHTQNQIKYNNTETGEQNRTQYITTQTSTLNLNINDIYLNTKSNIPNLYLFDNENIKYPYNYHLTLFMFQNYLKLLSFYYLEKKNINILINLTIKNIFDFKEDFSKNEIKENKKEEKNLEEDEDINNIDYFSNKNYKNFDFDIFGKIKIKTIKINLSNIHIFDDNIIYTFFKDLSINELLFKFSGFNDEKKVQKIIIIYGELIKKSNICYIQETPIISNFLIDNLSMNDLYLEYNILQYILEYCIKQRYLKKIEQTLLSLKFSAFKLMINWEKKNIQLIFDFSKFKERTLFYYLEQTPKLIMLIKEYEMIINILKEYKNFEIKIRLSQSNFRSHQLSFFFSLIIKKLVEYIEELKLSKIIILESTFNSFNTNMKIYIRNSKFKKKQRIEQIKNMIQSFSYYNKIKALNYFFNELEEYFDVIMLSDDYKKDFRLIRKCTENKIFFFICKDEKNINILEKENQKEGGKFSSTGTNVENIKKNTKQNQKSLKNYIEYLHIFVYIKSDQTSFSNIIDFLNNLIDCEILEIKNNITLICDRFYLESYVIMEQSLKSTTKKLFEIIDNYYLIAKKSKIDNQKYENFNYDIYIAEEYISVENYHQYNYKSDNNYSELVFEFLSSLSSCIELIVYSLRAKDLDLDKFYYIIRTINDKYYIFEYKNSNIFLKKAKYFDSLLFFDSKNTEPLLCVFPKIPESEYTMSMNNFYEVYLRLFLNLNKVEEQKEKLSQIFVYKIHKNIFYANYDSAILISFSYKAFNWFNDFLLVNNFLSATKDKFKNLYIFPFDNISDIKEYISLINNQSLNKSIVQNIIIYNYGLIHKSINSNNSLMSYRKSEYLLEKSDEIIVSKKLNKIETFKKVLFIILKRKKYDKKAFGKIISNIIKLMNKDKNIMIYHLSITDFEEFQKNYSKKVYELQTQKVDVRLQNLTQEAINNYSNKKDKEKDCMIF